MTILFDKIDRSRLGPARHDERYFEYLNQSARIPAGRVRDLMDLWFSRYPTASQGALSARVRSRSDVDFDTAAFELALHELFLKMGFRVLEIEPTLPNGRSPDFLVEDENGTRVYVEVVTAFDMSDEERATEARTNAAVQALDEASSPHFHLHLTVHGSPKLPVPLRRMRELFQSWIDALTEASEPWLYEFGEATFQVEVMAARSNWTPGSRAISARGFGGGAHSPHEPIREALKAKATRYGVLDHPFVIAINSHVMGQDQSDLAAALFGSEIIQVPISADAVGEPILLRAQDGFWLDHRGQRRRGVSGVLFFDRFSPWTANLRFPLLAVNPWAEMPVKGFGRITKIEVVEGKLQTMVGESLQDLFELRDDWLGQG